VQAIKFEQIERKAEREPGDDPDFPGPGADAAEM